MFATGAANALLAAPGCVGKDTGSARKLSCACSAGEGTFVGLDGMIVGNAATKMGG